MRFTKSVSIPIVATLAIVGVFGVVYVYGQRPSRSCWSSSSTYLNVWIKSTVTLQQVQGIAQKVGAVEVGAPQVGTDGDNNVMWTFEVPCVASEGENVPPRISSIKKKLLSVPGVSNVFDTNSILGPRTQ